MKGLIAKILVILSLLIAQVSFADVNLSGVYVLIGDSDGTVPKKNARITMTFKGESNGSVALLATQPGQTLKDTGTYSVDGSCVTMRFREMEWQVNNQQFQFDGCILILPFKALSGTPGPGTSKWVKEDPNCDQISITKENLSEGNSATDEKQPGAEESSDTAPGDTGKEVDFNAIDGKETCKQCKFIPCIKSFIKLREAYIDAIQKYAKEKKWGDLSKSTDRDFFYFKTYEGADKFITVVGMLNKDSKEFWDKIHENIDKNIFTELLNNCEMDASTLIAKTDSVDCKIDLKSLEDVENAVPCRELYELTAQHEQYHLDQCNKRKEESKTTKKWALLTLRGEAKEELVAYSRQIEGLKKLLEEASQSAKGGCWRCGKTQKVYAGKKECNDNCGRVTLKNPVYKCFKLNKDGEHEPGFGNAF